MRLRSVARPFATCFALALVPPAARAQSPDAANAVRAVVDSFFDAVAHERWLDAAARLDLPRFEPFLRQRIAYARSELPQPEMTVEDFLARSPDMPRAVAEWQLAQIRKSRGVHSFGDFSHEFAGVTSVRALVALTVPEAAPRWLQAQDERTQWREAMRHCLTADSLRPPTTRTVLAVAIGNDSTAYVVHADDWFGGDHGVYGVGPMLLTLHRSAPGWRIAPRYDVLRRVNMAINVECPQRAKQ